MTTPFGADGSSMDVRGIWQRAAEESARERLMRRIVTIEYVTAIEFGEKSMMGQAVEILISATDPRGFRYRLICVVDGMNHRSVAEQEVISALERRAAQFGGSVRIVMTMTEEVM